jgi:hypothetical protein
MCTKTGSIVELGNKFEARLPAVDFSKVFHPSLAEHLQGFDLGISNNGIICLLKVSIIPPVQTDPATTSHGVFSFEV